MRPAETPAISLASIFKDPLQKGLLVDAVESWFCGATGISPVAVASNPGIADLAPNLVGDLFMALLGRAPDDDALTHYSEDVVKAGGIREALISVLASDEFRQRFSRRLPVLPHPELSADEPAIVFVHVQKTGGTSLKNMLTDKFAGQKLYLEYEDTLHQHTPAELAQYGLFMGHFNYDSLSYIPKRNVTLFSFLRDPADRLASLYRFWRAHDPLHGSFHEGMAAARKLEFHDFLVERRFAPHADTWNHMSWAILGNRSWCNWKERLCNDPALDDEGVDELLVEFRTEIRERLQQFKFIGMQHDFDRSCLLLSNILGCDGLDVRHDHTIQALMEKDPLIKSDHSVTAGKAEYSAPMVAMTQLDSILFDEAQRKYADLLAEHLDAEARREELAEQTAIREPSGE